MSSAELTKYQEIIMSVTAPSATELSAMRYWWEDLPVGFNYQTSTRTITEADVVAFASLTADFNRAHVDAEYAAGMPYGKRIAHGMLVASYMAGLNTRTIVNQLLEPSLLALMDVQCKFLKPTFINDTIRVDVEVIETRETSNPDRGVVTFRRTAVNQNGEATVECIVKMLVRRSLQTSAA
jgi:acyl dehydratase